MWIQTSAAPLIPNQLNYYLNAGLGYNRRLNNYNLRYTHGVNGGSGVQPGALSDTVTGSASRTFSQQWAGTASLVYTRTSGLLFLVPGVPGTNNNAINTVYGTLQVTHGFTRTISGVCELHSTASISQSGSSDPKRLQRHVAHLRNRGFLDASSPPVSETSKELTIMLGHRTLNVDDYLGILKRRGWMVALPAISLALLGFALTFVVAPQYVSQTLILVEQQKVPDDYVRPVVVEDITARLASMKEQILSRSRLEPIIERFNLYGASRMSMDDRIDAVRKGHRY